nr:COR domain-containing protein [uncultured Rhodopila sp.]
MAGGAADLTDVKLLLLGNGGVGKTQIARWLSGVGFDPDWDSTHGIRICGQSNAGSLAERLHLCIWDFGGQDIYHGTHALFLRGPAVLMPVWARDRENRDTYEHGGLTFRNHPLAYWLDVVRHQSSKDNPVLIVQTKCDSKEQEERRFPIPDSTLDDLPYVTELRVSPKENRGLAALEESLRDAIAWMRAPGRLGLPQIGLGRLRVQRRLEAMRDADMALPRELRCHRLLERAEFDSICAEEGGISSSDMLLHYLDANGTVFHRPGLFADRIVLDQGWALEAIYAVFDRKKVYAVLVQDGGRFSRAKLGLLAWRDHSDAEQKLLLSMMVSCGICFPHRRFGGENGENDEYIAPDLLPERASVAARLAALWTDDRPGETATFRYALLHGGLIRSIMADIGAVAGADALYWRGGLCAFDAATHSRLLIEQETTGDWQGAIHVHTQAGDAASLLQKAVEVVERVQARLSMQPVAVERAPAPVRTAKTAAMTLVQEKPAEPEWYVSYAWGDDRTQEGRARQAAVDRLCEAAAAEGHHILRDKDVMSLGDSISAFMRRIGSGDRVFVILSDKYLRSEYCMFELNEVWRTSRQEGRAFLDRVRIYALPDADVWKPADWVKWAVYWKQEHDALEAPAREHGYVVLGDIGGRRLMQMQRFYSQVSDILGTLADIVQPRTFEELERYGFDDVPG